MNHKEFYNNKKKLIGVVSGTDNIFRKKVQGSKHLMKIFNAWGIDESILKELKEMKVETIRIKDMETNTVYQSTVDKFFEKGITRNYAGVQVFLPKTHFVV